MVRSPHPASSVTSERCSVVGRFLNITLLGKMPNPGPVCRMELVEDLFEDLGVDGFLPDGCLLYVPNSGLLEWILENTSPCDQLGRQVLIGLCEGSDVEDDLIRFENADGRVLFKRYRDLTSDEAAEFTKRLDDKAQKSQEKADRV